MTDVDKQYKRREKYAKKIFPVFAVILVVCLFIPSISAKYQYSYEAKSRMITSDAFYFSVDLTGDSKMVSEEEAQESYQFPKKEEKTWHLYGGAEHTIPIQLCNYYDALRVTQSEISYRATLFVTSPEGETIPSSLSYLVLENEENYATGQAIESVIGEKKEGNDSYEMEAENLILNIKKYADVKYKDGTTVKLLIESIAPYEKVTELNFILHHEDSYLSYEIKDSSGSSYAELIINNALDDIGEEGQKVQPYLSWPEELSIDNTNPLTYIYSGENGNPSTFTQQQIEIQGQMRRMQISEPMKTNESSSIYFFKSNIEQDYTQETTIVNPSSDGIFEIVINSQNPDTDLNHTSQASKENLETYLPQQTAKLSSGRQYSGVSSNGDISITGQSALTLEYMTEYVPSNYENMTESLQTSFHELYLWNGQDTAFTATIGDQDNLELQSIVKGNIPQSTADYEIYREKTQDGSDTYYITKTETKSTAQNTDNTITQTTKNQNDIITEQLSKDEGNIAAESTSEGESNIDPESNINIESGIHMMNEQAPTTDRENLTLTGTASSDFSIPIGTVITMVAQINNNNPTYWYYYCTEEKKEILLSDFRQMNTTYENTDENAKIQYNLYTASGNQINENEIVTENLRFIFDFSNTKEDIMTLQGASAKLKHTATINGVENVEIMDYTGQTAAENEITYYRSFPKISNTWKISQNNTNIESFQMSMTNPTTEYSTYDTYELQLEITENSEYSDTRCQERQYAVKLEKIETDENGNAKTDANGNIITGTFPEGMTISYNDQELTPTENNQVFILPVKSAGTHIFQMKTGLSAFHNEENGIIMLRASLYASKDASYYSDLNLDKTAFLTFKAKAAPDYALFVSNANSQEEKAHLFEKGEPLSLNIQTLKNGAVEPLDKAYMAIYRWNKQKQNYTHIEWSELFDGEENIDIELTNDSTIWTGHLLEEAAVGVYRLEFCYYDKIDYIDIIVK